MGTNPKETVDTKTLPVAITRALLGILIFRHPMGAGRLNASLSRLTGFVKKKTEKRSKVRQKASRIYFQPFFHQVIIEVT